MEDLIGSLTDEVSWYNILKAGGTDDWSKKSSLESNKVAKTTLMKRQYERHVGRLQSDAVSDLMNGELRKKFQIIPNNVRFGAQGSAVFTKQWGDFMTPNYDTVDGLLKKGIPVTIMNGQLDLICNTLGVELWLKRLTWTGINDFLTSEKKSFAPADRSKVYGFYKQYQNLQMFYILRGGHMIAHDAPWATLEAVKRLIGKN